MKNSRLIFIWMLISLNFSFLVSQENDEKDKQLFFGPVLDIHTYPKIFQEYDSIRTEYFKWYKENRIEIKKGLKKGILPTIPDEIFINYARTFTICHLYYTKVGYNGLMWKYRNGRHLSGPLKRAIKKNLPKKWSTLTKINGLVRVKPITDTLLHLYPSNKFFRQEKRRILTCKVVDDLLNTIEFDTIYILHKEDWLLNSSNLDLLIPIKSGAARLNTDKNKPTYYASEGAKTHSFAYYFIKDEIIYDPNNLDLDFPVKYELYKKEWKDFIIDNGILP